MKKRTKAAYGKLFDDPSSLFGEGTEVILFPNGEREIWIREVKNGNPTGRGFRIQVSPRASKPEHQVNQVGFGMTVSKFTGGEKMTVSSGAEPNSGWYETDYLELTEYYEDAPRAKAYREWYHGKGEYPPEIQVPITK